MEAHVNDGRDIHQYRLRELVLVTLDDWPGQFSSKLERAMATNPTAVLDLALYSPYPLRSYAYKEVEQDGPISRMMFFLFAAERPQVQPDAVAQLIVERDGLSGAVLRAWVDALGDAELTPEQQEVMRSSGSDDVVFAGSKVVVAVAGFFALAGLAAAVQGAPGGVALCVGYGLSIAAYVAVARAPHGAARPSLWGWASGPAAAVDKPLETFFGGMGPLGGVVYATLRSAALVFAILILPGLLAPVLAAVWAFRRGKRGALAVAAVAGVLVVVGFATGGSARPLPKPSRSNPAPTTIPSLKHGSAQTPATPAGAVDLEDGVAYQKTWMAQEGPVSRVLRGCIAKQVGGHDQGSASVEVTVHRGSPPEVDVKPELSVEAKQKDLLVRCAADAIGALKLPAPPKGAASYEYSWNIEDL